METIRGRLAVSYAIAMIATLAVFAVAMYLIERSWSREQIDRRLQTEADRLVQGGRCQSQRSACQRIPEFEPKPPRPARPQRKTNPDEQQREHDDSYGASR